MRITLYKIVNNIILVALVCVPLFTKAQNAAQNSIRSDAQKMVSFFKNKNYDGFLDITYPKIFEFQDRTSLKAEIKAILDGGDGISIEVLSDEDIPFHISDIYTTEDRKYAFVVYPMKMKMTFENETFDKETKQMMVNMMAQQHMNAKFESDNVIMISKTSLIIALNDSLTNGQWKYLNYDESPLFSKVISDTIISEAKDYLAKQSQKL